MTLLEQSAAMHRPNVQGDLPGPRSAALLERQGSRESNARVYGRHFPIAVEEASGSFIRDLDGNVFIDFLTGAGVLSLGHGHPELVAVATEQLGRFCHGLDLPSPAKDAFTTAQLSMLPDGMRDRMRMHFCGPTGANAVDAALKLCKTATGRSDVVAFSGGFHGTTHSTMAVTGVVSTKAPVANLMPGVHVFPYSHCSDCPLELSATPAPPTVSRCWSGRCETRTAASCGRRRCSWSSCRARAAWCRRTSTSCGGCAS